MPAYLSSRLSSLDGDDGDERASPFYYTRRRSPPHTRIMTTKQHSCK